LILAEYTILDLPVYSMQSTKISNNMRVTLAKHIEEYIIEVTFYIGENKVIDFRNFLYSTQNPMYTKYRDLNTFMQFNTKLGDLDWNDELGFSGRTLYNWKD
jgi:hypothetical protein